jgi:uncharacterized protein YceK
MRRLESPRRLAAVYAIVMLLLILTALSGCTAIQQGAHGIAAGFGAAWALVVTGAMAVWVLGGSWKSVLLMLASAVLLAIGGCAALPMPLQPQTDNNSNYAEGAFIVLAAVDTAQTMHIRKGTSCDHEADPLAAALYGSEYPKPGRVLLTNLALITVHTMVASWLDDKVEQHHQDDSAGLWYTGRIGFHAVSLVLEGSAVVNNHSRGCAL